MTPDHTCLPANTAGIILLCLILCGNAAGDILWANKGPYGGIVSALVIITPSHPQILYAGT